MRKQTLKKRDIRRLLSIARKIKNKEPVSPSQAEKIMHFELKDEKTKFQNILSVIALPGSIILGMTMAAFPQFYANLVLKLPAWTNMKPNMMSAVDYVWEIIGKPVKKPNIIYHIPNIILYSFGVAGVKKLFDFVRRKTWLDKVNEAKIILQERINNGELNYSLQDGHTILLVGDGDFIAEHFYLDASPDDAIILTGTKPHFTDHWLLYNQQSPFASLQKILTLADGYNCGEYMLFPVTDSELFLPGPKDYDVSPEKIEVLINSIRDIEKANNWPAKKIIIVGDSEQQSRVQTENKHGVLENSYEDVSLKSIQKRFEKIVIVDATELVLKKILQKYPGYRIFFRSSLDGSKAYKERFYKRLDDLHYTDDPSSKQTLIIGYDILEEQIERESLATDLQEYLPVVLSRDLYDALKRNGYAEDDLIFVPNLVLDSLEELAKE